MAKELSKEKIDQYKAMLTSTNATVREAATKKLREAGVPLTDKPVKVVKKAAPVKKKVPVVKKPSVKKVFIVDGKEINENDVNFCEKVLSAWKKRRKLAKTAASTYRTKSVMRIITEKVADTIEKAVNNVSAEEIKKNPKAFLSKVDKLEKSAVEFLNNFKEVLGVDFDKSEIKKEFDEFEKMIKSKVGSFKK